MAFLQVTSGNPDSPRLSGEAVRPPYCEAPRRKMPVTWFAYERLMVSRADSNFFAEPTAVDSADILRAVA